MWGRETKSIAHDFIHQGFRAIVVSVDSRWLNKSFAGRIYDDFFLEDLPAHVDPCGENGKFHTFVYDGPVFKEPVPFERGEVIYKKYPSPDKNHPEQSIGFWFCNLS